MEIKGRSFLLVLQDPRRSWRHAVHTPVREAMLVADGNGKSAIIGSYHLKKHI